MRQIIQKNCLLMGLPSSLCLVSFVLIIVLIDSVSAQSLTAARADLAAASLGGKVYFGGGRVGSAAASSSVDVFDVTSNSMTDSRTLTLARTRLAAASSDYAVLFAGGATNPNDPDCLTASDRVDIIWLNGSVSTANLTAPRCDLSAVRAGRYIYFVGGIANGNYSAVVDRYDTCSNTWDALQMKYARSKVATAAWYDIAFFGGGETTPSTVTDQVEVLAANGSFLGELTLSVGRSKAAAIAVSNRVYFFGGTLSSDNASTALDIFSTSNNWNSFILQSQQLSCPRESPHAVLAGNIAVVDWGTLNNCPCFQLDTTVSPGGAGGVPLTDLASTTRSIVIQSAGAAVTAQPFSYAVFGGGITSSGGFSSGITSIRLDGADPPLDYCTYGPPTSAPPTSTPSATTPSSNPTTTPAPTTPPPTNGNSTNTTAPPVTGACGPMPFANLVCRSGIWESSGSLQPDSQLANVTTAVHIKGGLVITNMSVRYFYPLPLTVDGPAQFSGQLTFYINSVNKTKVPSQIALIKTPQVLSLFDSVNVIDILACMSHKGSYLQYNSSAQTVDLFLRSQNRCKSKTSTGLIVGVVLAVSLLVIALAVFVGALWYTGRLESCFGSISDTSSSNSSKNESRVHMLSNSM